MSPITHSNNWTGMIGAVESLEPRLLMDGAYDAPPMVGSVQPSVVVSAQYLRSYNAAGQKIGTLDFSQPGSNDPTYWHLIQFSVQCNDFAPDQDLGFISFNVDLGSHLKAWSTGYIGGGMYDSDGDCVADTNLYSTNQDAGPSNKDLQGIVGIINAGQALDRQPGEAARVTLDASDGLGYPTVIGYLRVQWDGTDTYLHPWLPDNSSWWCTWDGNSQGAGTMVAQTGRISTLDYHFSAAAPATNHAPVLDNSSGLSLSGIDEDAVSNSGTTVAAMLASHGSSPVTDADSGALQGVAVTAADTSHGAWQFSLDGGGTWQAMGSVSTSTARLLRGTDRVRFGPAANWNGTVANALTLRAWDQTSGTAGGTADTTANGGQTAFSTATVGASIVVAPVNDAPTATGASVTVLENGWSLITLSGSDVETASGSLTFNVPGQTAHGTLTPVDGSTYLYQPDADYAGGDSFTFTATDDGTGDPLGTPLTSSPATITLTVSPVNHAPVFTPGGDVTVDEDAGAQTVSHWATGISAGADNEAGQTLSFEVQTDDPGLFRVAPTMSADGTLHFTAADNANGQAVVTVILHDNGGTDNGGADASEAEYFLITVNPVNDAPVNSVPIAQTLGTSGTVIFSAARGNALRVTDVDAEDSSEQVTLTVNSGTLTLADASGLDSAVGDGTGSVVIVGTLDAINTALDGLTYTAAAGQVGSATLQMVTNDLGNTGSGGELTDTDSVSISLGRSVNLNGQGLAQYTDRNGNVVTMQLKGGGSGTIYFASAGRCDPTRIVLSGTTYLSTLTITSRVTTTVGDIQTSPIGSISAVTTSLQGTLTIARAVNAGATTVLNFCRLENAAIDSAMPIRSLTANEWLDSDATPDTLSGTWIGAMNITGNATLGMAGRLQASVTLSGQNAGQSISTLSVAGAMSGDWTMPGAAGTWTVGSWTAGSLHAASLARLTAKTDLGSVDMNIVDTVGTIQARRWTAGSLQADSLQTLNLTGQSGVVAGDMGASVMLWGRNVRAGYNTLNIATIAGAIRNSMAVGGNVGSMKMGQLRGAVTIDGKATSVTVAQALTLAQPISVAGILHVGAGSTVYATNKTFRLTSAGNLYASA